MKFSYEFLKQYFEKQSQNKVFEEESYIRTSTELMSLFKENTGTLLILVKYIYSQRKKSQNYFYALV